MAQRHQFGERLLPCLIDRLTDQYPRASKESREHRAVALRQYRDSVLQELVWLLNCESHPGDEQFGEFPEISRSVVNYGLRSLSGINVSRDAAADIEEQIRQAILVFEPRILPTSLSVRLLMGETDTANQHSTVTLEIAGDLYATPMPEQLYLRTEVDLETGDCDVRTQ